MKITIFDPAMCCSTGVCGTDVDDVLVQTAANVKWLKATGHEVDRHGIANDAAAFKNYPEAIAKLQKEGTDSLPYIFIDNRLVMSGRYPEKAEWESLLSAGAEKPRKMVELTMAPVENKESGSCCSGSGCC